MYLFATPISLQGFSTPTNKGFEWVKFNITLDNSGQMLKVQRLTVRMADVNKQLIMDGRVELLDTQVPLHSLTVSWAFHQDMNNYRTR